MLHVDLSNGQTLLHLWTQLGYIDLQWTSLEPLLTFRIKINNKKGYNIASEIFHISIIPSETDGQINSKTNVLIGIAQ